MTEFIAMCGCVFMLMFFPMQYTNDQINYYNITEARDRIEESVEVAKQDGCFTAVNQSALRTDLAAMLDTTSDQITITATGTPVYRGNTYATSGIIYYEVDFPVGDYLAINEFWGVSDAQNKMKEKISGRVASEKIQPL